MKINREKELPVPSDIAWQALNDIALLKACIPGCESIEASDDGSYAVAIAASIGPVRAKFKGQMRMKDVVAPTSYTLEFNGQGGAAGFCRGDAKVLLSPLGAQTTSLRYSANAQVGGKLAQVGARLIDIAADKMAADFFTAFVSELGTRHPPATARPSIGQSEPGGTTGVWASLIAWLSRLFGKSAA